MDAALEKRLKRQVIGKPHLFLAVVPLGFEQTLAHELEFCNPQVVGDGKVEFTAKITDAWKAVAYTRIANRVLMHIAEFKAENFRELEKKAAEIPWELYLPCHPAAPSPRLTAVPGLRHTAVPSGTSVSTKQDMDSLAPTGLRNDVCTKDPHLNIHVTCKHSRLYHSDAVAERLYNVIGENLHNCHSGAEGDRVKAEDFPQNLFVTLIDDRCTIWLDLAGEELYKRGHERHVNDAPLKETIAAAMLFELSALHIINHQSSIINYPLSIALIDPMAGSGTFSLEAAYMASGLIPGVCRDFALKHQPAFKPATWNHIVTPQGNASPSVTPKREAQVCPLAAIATTDISERAISIIRHNVECSPLASAPQGRNAPAIAPQVKDFFTYTAEEIACACPAGSQPAMVLNPPYGKRLDCDAPRLYAQIGRKLGELAHDLNTAGQPLTVAILSPKDDTRNGAKYTCTANLLQACPALDPARNPQAKKIVTSHGGITLNVFIATL